MDQFQLKVKLNSISEMLDILYIIVQVYYLLIQFKLYIFNNFNENVNCIFFFIILVVHFIKFFFNLKKKIVSS